MSLFCSVCGEYRKARKYILFPEYNYIREEIEWAYCNKCQRDIVDLYSTLPDGNIEKRNINRIGKFLKRRIINYEEKATNRQWKKAKGYRYFKGFKGGRKGGVYSLSDNRREETVKAKLNRPDELMNRDIKKYKIYELYRGKLAEINYITSTADYDHFVYHLHHYVPRKTIKKYPHLEEYQRLILMHNNVHMNLHGSMDEKRFFELYKCLKMDLIYNVKEKGRDGD